MKDRKINNWLSLVMVLLVIVAVLGIVFEIAHILNFKYSLLAFIPLLIIYQVLYMVKNKGSLTKITKVILIICMVVLTIIFVDNIIDLFK